MKVSTDFKLNPLLLGCALLLFASHTAAILPWDSPQQNDAFLRLLQNNPPVGINIFSQYHATTNKVPDARGNGYDVMWTAGDAPVLETEPRGFNADNDVTSLYGRASTQLQWSVSMAATFTVCWATRYHNATSENQRILDTVAANSFLGHDDGQRGGVYYNGEQYARWAPTNASVTHWLIACFTNNRTDPSAYVIDQRDSGDGNTEATLVSKKLGVNNYGYPGPQNGDFNIHSVYVWDRELSNTDMKVVTSGIRKELGGVPDLSPDETPAVFPISDLRAYYFRYLLVVRPPQSMNIFSDLKDSVVVDRMGNGFNAQVTAGEATVVSTTGNGAVNIITVLQGSITTAITWPAKSIPSTMTICTVSRYRDTANQGWFFLGNYFFHAHGGASVRGLAYYGTLRTTWDSVGIVTDWLIMCGNTENREDSVVVDQTDRGVVSTNPYLYEQALKITDSTASADFQFHSLYIWNQHLSNVQMKHVTSALRAYIGGTPDFTTHAVLPMLISENSTAYSVPCARGLVLDFDTGDCLAPPVKNCIDCGQDMFASLCNISYAGECHACTTCSIGEFESVPCNVFPFPSLKRVFDVDRECMDCLKPNNTVYTGLGLCDWECTEGFYLN
ncbi:hypothetical protein T484DRAFT_1757993, partial [Baffinella frigidus]